MAALPTDISSWIPEVTPDVGMQLCSQITRSMLITP